jgi:hypothetical protein
MIQFKHDPFEKMIQIANASSKFHDAGCEFTEAFKLYNEPQNKIGCLNLANAMFQTAVDILRKDVAQFPECNFINVSLVDGIMVPFIQPENEFAGEMVPVVQPEEEFAGEMIPVVHPEDVVQDDYLEDVARDDYLEDHPEDDYLEDQPEEEFAPEDYFGDEFGGEDGGE